MRIWVEGPDHILIFYEDLARDTAREMHRIARFLQVPYEEIFERPSLFGIEVKVGTSSRDTKAVFLEKKDWKEGLSLREQMVITGFRHLYPLFRRVAGKKAGGYRSLRKAAVNAP